MADREKLIDLMIQAKKADTGDAPFSEFLADFLLASGVTFGKDTETCGKWISVEDRLPDPGEYVVCIAKRNPFSRFMPMVAKIEKNGWVNPITEQYISAVTHWMPLPSTEELK